VVGKKGKDERRIRKGGALLRDSRGEGKVGSVKWVKKTRFCKEDGRRDSGSGCPPLEGWLMAVGGGSANWGAGGGQTIGVEEVGRGRGGQGIHRLKVNAKR